MIGAALAGPALKLGAAVLVVGGLALAAYVQTVRLDAAEAHAANARQAAEASAATIAKLREDEQLKLAIIRDQAAALERTRLHTDDIRKEIRRAPTSSACAADPAVGAAWRGLRSWPAGDAPRPGGPQPAGRAGAPLPTAPSAR